MSQQSDVLKAYVTRFDPEPEKEEEEQVEETPEEEWTVWKAPQSRTFHAYGTEPVRGHLSCRLDGGIDHTLQSFEETD